MGGNSFDCHQVLDIQPFCWNPNSPNNRNGVRLIPTGNICGMHMPLILQRFLLPSNSCRGRTSLRNGRRHKCSLA